jgi:leucyl/phenylalanyl-tRNA--protein transferase
MSQFYRLPGGDVLALDKDSSFPPLDTALQQPNGLLAIGGELTPEKLLEAYRQGIFPWFSADEPILWWSPDPRMVLFPGELKISRSLAKRLKKGDYQVRFDTAFRDVMQACSGAERKRQSGTWIVPQMIEAYCQLHARGYAHSAETWMDGELVGGLYGVTIAGMFYGESMFHRTTDASKIAFVHLVRQLQIHGCGMIDCQMHTHHLARFGAREIPRQEFAERLAKLVDSPYPAGNWKHHDPAQ